MNAPNAAMPTHVFVGQNVMGGETLAGLLRSGLPPALVVTREANGYPNRVEELAQEWGVPVLRISGTNRDPRLVDALERLQPDVVLCSAWPDIVREPLLRMPRLGWVNFHPSYLPAYRGGSPISWQLIHGEEWGGCTAHFMAPEFDAGEIIVQERIRIDLEDDSATLRRKCGAVLGGLAVRTLRLLADPEFRGVPQDEAQASYFPLRDNHRLIDWSRPAGEIVNLVRGLSPYPCAVFPVGGLELRVAAVRPAGLPPVTDGAGRILGVRDQRLLVGAGDAVVEVLSLRLADRIVADYLAELPELAAAAAAVPGAAGP